MRLKLWVCICPSPLAQSCPNIHTCLYLEACSGLADSEMALPRAQFSRPILFNVIINTLEETLKNCVELTQFADDGAFWKTAKKTLRRLSQPR